MTRSSSGPSSFKDKYKALKRKGMSKTRAAKIADAGKSSSRKGGKKSGRAEELKVSSLTGRAYLRPPGSDNVLEEAGLIAGAAKVEVCKYEDASPGPR